MTKIIAIGARPRVPPVSEMHGTTAETICFALRDRVSPSFTIPRRFSRINRRNDRDSCLDIMQLPLI